MTCEPLCCYDLFAVVAIKKRAVQIVLLSPLQVCGQLFLVNIVNKKVAFQDMLFRQSNPDITAYMKANNITGDYAKLEEVYIQQILDISTKIGLSYIVWQEVFDNGVKVMKHL